MPAPRPPLLAVVLDAAALAPERRVDPRHWRELVTALEDAGVDLVTLGDTHRGEDGVARLDATMLAATLAMGTRRIGILPAADTATAEPFLLASQIATLDFLSRGRAGWLLQVSGRAEDAGYVGPRGLALGAEAWEDAEEFLAVVADLWDSWEDDAEIRDVATQRFIDTARVHHIDFHGRHLDVIGPSITPRPPQGQPPVAIALGADGPPEAPELAIGRADIALLGPDVEVHPLRRAALERERPLRVLIDVPVARANVTAVRAALGAGADGVRILPGRLPEDLDAITGLARELRAGRADDPPGAATPSLRDRLGLARPQNRFAASPRDAAPAGIAADRNGNGR